MSYNITFNGQTYTLPSVGDSGWGDQINNYLTAISTGTMQKNTTTFNLLDEMSFGGDYGIKSLYFKSYSTNPSATGVLRLANTDVIAWRNDTNTSDLTLAIGGSSGQETIVFNNNELLAIPLIKEADFGNSYGTKVLYIKSQTSNPAASGLLRLAYSDTIKWRNGTNSDDLSLSVSGTDLYWNGSKLNDQGGGGGGNVNVPLTSGDCNFGNSYGTKMLYLKSQGTNISTEGVIRLANLEKICWRSFDNTRNIPLQVSGSENTLFIDGSKIITENTLFPGATLFGQTGETAIGSSGGSSYTDLGDLSIGLGGAGEPTIVRFEAYIRYYCTTTGSGIAIEYEGPTDSIVTAEIIIQTGLENISQLRFPNEGSSNQTGNLSGNTVNTASAEQVAIVRGLAQYGGVAGTFMLRFKATDNGVNHAYVLPFSTCTYTIMQM